MAAANCVIDLSHHNGMVDLRAARCAGILGLFHKATEADPAFAGNRLAAAEAKLLFGAYHFGTGGDGARQAEHFLATVTLGLAICSRSISSTI
jgi:lysozyme